MSIRRLVEDVHLSRTIVPTCSIVNILFIWGRIGREHTFGCRMKMLLVVVLAASVFSFLLL